MTTPEHALVGIHSALALGVHRRWGWQSVALVAVCSVLPDWDGLLLLISISLYDTGHRVWGHSLISIVPTSLILAYSQFRWNWISRLVVRLLSRIAVSDAKLMTTDVASESPRTGFAALTFLALAAQLTHLPCDMVVSGGNGLSDWPVQLWWPFSSRGYVFPLIPWGDVGPTVILMAGVLLAARMKKSLSIISAGTMLTLIVYLLSRGWMRGTI